MKHFIIAVAGFILIAGTGCSQNIPMKSSINEFVLMNITTASQKGIDYSFSSNLVDNKLPIYGKDKKALSGSGSYNCDETQTLNTMLREYIQNKFLEITDSSPISLDVKLEDFYVEYYNIDSAGTIFLQIMSDEDSNYLSSAKLTLMVTLKKDGQEIFKRFTTSADASSSGTQSVNMIGDSINQANNKALMLLNAFLAENGL